MYSEARPKPPCMKRRGAMAGFGERGRALRSSREPEVVEMKERVMGEGKVSLEAD